MSIDIMNMFKELKSAIAYQKMLLPVPPAFIEMENYNSISLSTESETTK